MDVSLAVPRQVVQTNDSELDKNVAFPMQTRFGAIETAVQALGLALERLAKGVEVSVA